MISLAPWLVWACPACLVESDEGFCECCGRTLTREHLAAYLPTDTERGPAAQEVNRT